MNEPLNEKPGLTTVDIARGDCEALAEPGDHTPPPGDQPSLRDDRPLTGRGVRTAKEQQPTPLFPTAEAQELRSRWDSIQTDFVDEPRKSVEEADALVAAAIKRLAEIFTQERSQLEGQWTRGDDVSTEDLRVALQRYRSFFTRLLSM